MDAQPCKKIRHLTRAGAERHMARIESINARFGRTRPGFTLHTYYHPECAAWHIGHKRREEPAS
jgi:hypothetical protein